MNTTKIFQQGKTYIQQTARPLELALYEYYIENGDKQKVLQELKKFQNEDGGFGHALELDNWNPNSNPIATNDALITLNRMKALDESDGIMDGILRYLASHDSYNSEKQQWLFAIESNKEYPHAIWWEKDGDGISLFNPTISLATVLACYGINKDENKKIIQDGYDYLKTAKLSGDLLKCYMLSYELLLHYHIQDVVDLDEAKQIILTGLQQVICKDTAKYGVEYVFAPSDLNMDPHSPYLTEEMMELIHHELEVMDLLQAEDGGYNISWQWYTPYEEFTQAKAWWRARITIDKLLYIKNFMQ